MAVNIHLAVEQSSHSLSTVRSIRLPNNSQFLAPGRSTGCDRGRAMVPVSWVSFYIHFSKTDCYPISDSQTGMVICPVCSQHFSNIQLLRHLILHLLVNELSEGSLTPLQFCVDCLCCPSGVSLAEHRSVHQHLELSNPSSLLDGQCVCPICEISFDSIVLFAVHLHEKHVFHDSPYVCPVCYSFHTSRYSDLLTHFRTVHSFTNHVFCPYCLKHFELANRDSCTTSGPSVFTAQQLYTHMLLHWDQTTYRCESCRLDFLRRKDHRLHEYLYHSGFPLIQPPGNETSCSSPSSPPLHAAHHHHALPSTSSEQSPNHHLYLYYSNQLRTQAPRLGLKCSECGEPLRHPISRHFMLTLRCPSCKYTTSCSTAVNWHWCNVHFAPPIPPFSTLEAAGFREKRVRSSSVAPVKNDCKPSITAFSPRVHDPCGSTGFFARRCRTKHSPAGLEYTGLLRCPCGFRSIVGDQMAKHLNCGSCGFTNARLDYSTRVTIFSVIKTNRKRVFRSVKLWQRRLTSSPAILQSVGLCPNRF